MKKQTFEKEEGRIRMEMGFSWWGVFAGDGKLYGANPDWSKWDSGGAMNIYQYDPGLNEVKLFKVIPGCGGERNPMALSPNGWVYGAGTYLGEGPDSKSKAAAFGFNPETGEVRDYGAVGPRINGTGYGYSMGVCDTHIYVACGQIPWYLVAINIKTGEQDILLEAPEGGYKMRMYVSAGYGGAQVYAQKGDDAPRKYYWLYHGKAIPKTDDMPPWPPQKSPSDKAPPRPELHTGQVYPNSEDVATIWYRLPEDKVEAPEIAPADAKPKDLGWKAVRLEGVEKHLLKLHRLVNLPDGRLFGTAQGYKGRFLFDPETMAVIELGDGGTSLYAFVPYKDRLYWSGYPSAQIFVFDPSKPWTLSKGGPPGHKAPEMTNPHRVGDQSDAFKKTRVKKMLSGVLAADGQVYFGGKGQRDYHGGGLSWINPETHEIGGMWEPFRDYPICWITTALEDRYVVISTRNQKLFVYDVETARIVREIVPVPDSEKAGPVVEVAPGRLLGTTEDPEVKGGGILYGIDAQTGEVLFRKKLPYTLQFPWTHGTAQWDYQKGPDGFVWTVLDNALVRIDPADLRIHVLGKLDNLGKFAFVANNQGGHDLYLTGTEQMRRIANADDL
ncbi:hypothetical protein ACFL6S_29110 [Candidatus Poribacteria bacterium]